MSIFPPAISAVFVGNTLSSGACHVLTISSISISVSPIEITGSSVVSPSIIASRPIKSITFVLASSSTNEPYSGLNNVSGFISSSNAKPILLPKDILLTASAIPPPLTVWADTQVPFSISP